MVLKEIFIISTVLIEINCRSIFVSKPKHESENAIKAENPSMIAETGSNFIGLSKAEKNDFHQTHLDVMEKSQMKNYKVEHDFEIKKLLDKNSSSDESFELSEFEIYRQSIFDMLIILFRNHEPVKYRKDRPIYQENEVIIFDYRIRVDNYIYNTNILLNDYINLVFDLEEYILKPSNVSKTFQNSINTEEKLINLEEKFVRIFAFDINVHKFPLIFYEVIFPYLKRNLMPILNGKRISEKTSRVLGYEIERPNLFETLKSLSEKIEFPKENKNLKNFLNTLNKILSSSEVDKFFYKEIKNAYLILLAEWIAIIKFEFIEAAIPANSFIYLFDALLPKFVTKRSVSKNNLSKQHVENKNIQRTTSFCLFCDHPLGELVELTFCEYKAWFIGLLNRVYYHLL